MLNSLARKSFAVALIIVVPPLAVLGILADLRATPWLAVLAAIPGIVVAVLVANAIEGDIRQLAGFVNRMLEPGNVPKPLPHREGEFGGLASALTEAAPKIHDLIHRLTTELTRREAMLVTMVEGVIAVDARLNITFCNHAFLQAFGQSQIVEGEPLIKAVRDPALFQLLKEVIDSRQTIRRHIRISARDGHSFDVCASPLPGATTPGAMALLHDVTPSENLDRVRRDFVANVSHEFRTPLATIRGYAETLLDGGLEDNENCRKFVEIILANAVRLNNIAADLLTLSELEEGRPQAEGVPILVADVVCAAIRVVEPAAKLCGVQIQSGPFSTAYVWGHRIRFEQAIVNLLDNGVKFNKPGGEVQIQVAMRPDEKVEIAISDTGMGIPAHDLNRIFERFYRVDKARSRQVGGTGLGLSIVKHAAQQMGGSVSVASELGRGSTFTVVLPARHSPSRVS
jgi:two-component system phosphate regulon sensor histidine kinase PhoR